jgi:endonuclease/exonuclease/phosphatase family metal-dependent hydrolase
MPFYNDLRPIADYEFRDYALVFPDMTVVEKKRTINNLLRLKAGLAAKIPAKKADENLLVASWNVKEFGHTTQRLYESYFYIAEVISRFDLVVVQEIKSTLKGLDTVMRILGSDWDYLINDITDGVDGNSERSAYLFNKKRVRLSGLAGEITLWSELTENSEIKQLKRTPYMTGFKSGWKSFAVISFHLHPGDDDEDTEFRKEEVELILEALEKKEDGLWTRNLVLAGDFNLYETDTETVELINNAGYTEVEGLEGKDTNVSESEAYDRLFVRKSNYFQILKDDQGVENGDVFKPFEYVFVQNEHTQYKADMIEVYGGGQDLENDADALGRYFSQYWKRNQISDHNPIWFEISIDSSVRFLESKLDDFP